MCEKQNAINSNLRLFSSKNRKSIDAHIALKTQKDSMEDVGFLIVEKAEISPTTCLSAVPVTLLKPEMKTCSSTKGFL